MADLNIDQLTEDLSPALADFIITSDQSAGPATRKAKIGNIPIVNGQAAAAPAVADELVFYDVSGGANAKATVSTVLALLTINDKTDKATPVGADEVLLADSADSFNVKKATVSAIVALAAVTINDKTAKSPPVAADELLVADSADTFTVKKMTIRDAVAPGPSTAPAVNDEIGFVDVSNSNAVGKTEAADLPREAGQIYGCPGAAQTFSIDTPYAAIPVALWDTDGPSTAGIAPDQTNGRITVNRTGLYHVTIAIAARRANPITDIDFALFRVAGDVEITSVRRCDIRLDTYSERFTIVGLVNATAGDVYEVRGRRPTGANTIELWDASMVFVGLGV